MEIRDSDLILRPMEPGDVEPMITGLDDSEVGRFMSVIPYPYTADDAEAWLERYRTVWADGSSQPFSRSWTLVPASSSARSRSGPQRE